MNDFSTIHAETPKVYQAHAKTWDEQRPLDLSEAPWLRRFSTCLKPAAQILDVGCGAGRPIAEYFIQQGFKVTGIDVAGSMIDIAQTRFPDVTWIEMDMRQLSLGRKFDGIVAWDSFFHLNHDEQRHTLELFFSHLKADGAILLTVGPKAGEVLGEVAGQPVYHSSLDPEEYKSILEEAGFGKIEHVANDARCGGRSILFGLR